MTQERIDELELKLADLFEENQTLKKEKEELQDKIATILSTVFDDCFRF